MYEKLFEKGRIGNVELKNRLVMTPMGTNLAELDGTVGPAMLADPDGNESCRTRRYGRSCDACIF